MFLDAISGAANVGNKSAGDGQRIAENFDTFLQLLTTQLRNQNPLDPLDTNQFTQQLVQFSGVEQSIRTNQNLELLVRVSAANAATAATSFIGKRITVDSTTTTLADGTARWSYKAEREAPSATFTIRDEAGAVIWSEEKSLPPGRGSFEWNGKTSDGNFASDGSYTLTIDAKDASGGTVAIGIETAGVIDGVDFSGTEPLLLVGDKSVPLSAVRSVSGL